MTKAKHTKPKWTGNLGEWSELYTLFKLISEKRLNLTNSKIDETNYHELTKIQPAIPPESISFQYSNNKTKVLVKNTQTPDEQPLEIDITTFNNYETLILNTLKTHKKGTFSIPKIVPFLEKLGFTGIKSPSKNKSDTFLSWQDTNIESIVSNGFSIKSLLGSNPTLFNSSIATNITYRFENSIPKNEIQKFNYESFNKNNKNGIKDLLPALAQKYTLLYHDIESDTFKNNLLMIDDSMPSVLAEAIKLFYCSKTRDMESVVKQLAADNPKNYSTTVASNLYKQKIKKFLRAAALGMTAATAWTGFEENLGGIIVVNKDFSINGIPMMDSNSFNDYLLETTKFDSPSRSRYKYGEIYEVDNEQFIKLNFQIRYK